MTLTATTATTATTPHTAQPRRRPAPRVLQAKNNLADAIYRPYFLAGIAVVLTLGALWGAWLLWRIGIAGDFRAVDLHEINAHGHAQIFGWVGLFILGFAMQFMPRMWRTTLPMPRLALLALAVMLLGLVTRTVAIAAAGASSAPVIAPVIALIGGALELVALIAVVSLLVTAFRHRRVPLEPYMGFVLASLGWFVIQAILGLWHTWATMTATDRHELLWQVATWQGPLRDLQIHGLAMFMILGVSMRILPGIFTTPRASDRRGWIALVILITAVIAEVSFFLAYRWTGSHAMAAGLLASWMLLAVGVLVVALPWKIHRPMSRYDRSAKFIRAAYTWLAISLLMLLMFPGYQILSGLAFSHAYHGAIRHAITVGFISMMIMGVAAKFVPGVRGYSVRHLPTLVGPFILINLGCALRVSTQTLTDWHPAFYGIIGISGTLEVIALGWWGIHLASLMLRPPIVPLSQLAASHPAAPTPPPHTAPAR